MVAPKKYIDSYKELLQYILSYRNCPEDVNHQVQFVEEYWEEFCVKKVKVLGLTMKIHNENAKNKWAELDSLVRRNLKDLGGSYE